MCAVLDGLRRRENGAGRPRGEGAGGGIDALLRRFQCSAVNRLHRSHNPFLPSLRRCVLRLVGIHGDVNRGLAYLRDLQRESSAIVIAPVSRHSGLGSDLTREAKIDQFTRQLQCGLSFDAIRYDDRTVVPLGGARQSDQLRVRQTDDAVFLGDLRHIRFLFDENEARSPRHHRNPAMAQWPAGCIRKRAPKAPARRLVTTLLSCQAKSSRMATEIDEIALRSAALQASA